MGNLTHLLPRQEYKGKIYVKNIRTNLCRIRNKILNWSRIRNQLKSRMRIRKNSGSTTLILLPNIQGLQKWRELGSDRIKRAISLKSPKRIRQKKLQYEWHWKIYLDHKKIKKEDTGSKFPQRGIHTYVLYCYRIKGVRAPIDRFWESTLRTIASWINSKQKKNDFRGRKKGLAYLFRHRVACDRSHNCRSRISPPAAPCSGIPHGTSLTGR